MREGAAGAAGGRLWRDQILGGLSVFVRQGREGASGWLQECIGNAYIRMLCACLMIPSSSSAPFDFFGILSS